jgi:hypothetical protein
MSPVHDRIALLITEILHERGQPLATVAVPQSTLARVAGGRRDYLLSTLIEVAGAVGFDVVVNLRERP